MSGGVLTDVLQFGVAIGLRALARAFEAKADRGFADGMRGAEPHSGGRDGCDDGGSGSRLGGLAPDHQPRHASVLGNDAEPAERRREVVEQKGILLTEGNLAGVAHQLDAGPATVPITAGGHHLIADPVGRSGHSFSVVPEAAGK
jgi:hypothetical protein